MVGLLMPALDKREEQEAALLLLLMRPFDEARRQAVAGQVDWNKFEADVQAALEQQLAAVFLLAAIAMGASQSHVGGAAGGGTWATSYSRSVASEITATSAARIAAGADPATVFSEQRAETIAVTETTSAITRGEAEVAGDIETKTGKVLEPFWQTARDAKVCPVCAPLNGTPRDVWGGDHPAGPPAHPNCRCNLIYRTLSEGLGV